MANTLTFANRTITDANIFGGVSYLADLNTGNEFTIGNTASASVTFVTDIQLPLYTKDNVNGTFTWTQDGTPRGRYYITETKKDSGKYTVTAYDAMYLLDTKISALSISYPATMADIVPIIATYIGCTVSGTLNNGTLFVVELDPDLTIRTLLGYIAEASGCSVKIDGSDHLCFMYYADSGITVTASEYVKLEVADYTCAPIDLVMIYNLEGSVQASAGSGTNALYIGQNPFLNEATNTHAATILSQVSGFSYAPLHCDMFTENGLEIGTIATFGTTPTLVMHIDSSENGATVSSVGSDSRAEYNKSISVEVSEAKAEAAAASAVAVNAQAVAADAAAAASDAFSAANSAQEAAESAADSASSAQLSADAAQDDADTAKASALSATALANSALMSLSEVEKVVDVLKWASEHGTYALTADTEVADGKYYFTRSGSGTSADPYVYTAVTTPASNPSGAGYYELTGVDEAISNYVSTHLALTPDGLFLQVDNNACKIQITSTGIYLYDASGVIIAKYSDTVTLGPENDIHITLGKNQNLEGELGFWQGTNEVAYINQNKLYIKAAEITKSQRIGDFVWNVQASNRVSLIYSPVGGA